MANFSIVIVDDDEDDYFILKEVFDEMVRHEITSLHDGQQLLDYLKESAVQPNKLPDIILLDINMPKMNGIKALEFMKMDPVLKTIPVIIYSTSNDAMQVTICKSLGATGFITKGSTHEELLSAVSKINTLLLDLPLDPLNPVFIR